jgi:CubicO group peptidase (beta-lactamase class C family)
VNLICVLIIILTSLTLHPQLLAAVAQPDSAALDQAINAHMQASGIVGMAAAIVVQKKVVWAKGYGFSDREREVPFTPNTLMNVGSIAKPFLGVALMRAVREGKLSLDVDINRYLPFRVINPHHPKAKITLRQLATHTSSISDRTAVYARTYHYGRDSPESLAHFLKHYFATDGKNYSSDNFLTEKPGTQRVYSNIGAALAGYIVERAFNEPLNVYTRKHIFAPLDMSNSGWLMSEIDLAQHTKLYVSHNGHIIPIPLYGGTTYPDGGVRTSVLELSKFFIALLNDGELNGVRILDAANAAEMQRFQFSADHHPENFPASEGNSGLFWRTKYNGALVGHGGNDPGIQTEMLSDRAREVGLILFMNTSLSGPEQQASHDIFETLWKQALALKQDTKQTFHAKSD